MGQGRMMNRYMGCSREGGWVGVGGCEPKAFNAKRRSLVRKAGGKWDRGSFLGRNDR